MPDTPRPDDHEYDEFSETEPRDPSAMPAPDDDDTDEIDIPEVLRQLRATDSSAADESEADDDVPFHLPLASTDDEQPTLDQRESPHNQATMPHFREPGLPDPKATLPGTGGLDPNPDMVPQRPTNASPANHSQRVPQVPSQRPPHEPSVQRPEGGMTVPNPALHDARYRRPQQPANQPQAMQGQYVPRAQQPAPAAYHPQGAYRYGQQEVRRPTRRSRILGFRPGCLYTMLGLFITFCGGLTFVTMGAAALFIPQIEEEWSAEIARVDTYRAFESTFFYSRDEEQLYESFNEGRRDTVPFNRFPQDLIDATVSIEDDTFWSNPGIDVAATAVATFNFLRAEDGERTAGGSTITQQLVRNVLFDFEKRSAYSVQRKAEEIILALLLTTRREKEAILELYLNEIYYGNLAYGAQAAARTFFNKDVQDLTLGEAAMLAGLPQAPASLDPLNPDPVVQSNVYARQRLVLNEMVEEGYITTGERDAALREGLNFNRPGISLNAPHFTVYAQERFADLMSELGYSTEDVAAGGYRVYTTVDLDVTQAALSAARQQVAGLATRNVSNAAVIVLQPTTGQILAMVGSVDYNSEIIDGRVNVTIALRQPGSTMKPFTYAAAMERGMTPGDVIWDTPTEIGIPGQPTYVPRNYNGRFHGPMTMRAALANSYNIPAVQTLRLIGVESLIDMMQRTGVSTLNDPAQYGLSLTLGGGEVSLLELANAYGTFANQGAYVEPAAILCVIDRNDNILYQYENGCPLGAGNFTSNTVDQRGFGRQAIDPRVSYIITDILSDNAARTPAMGSNSALRTDGIGSAVKTGTTDDVKDNWTIGYTRNVVVGVWVGNNDGDPMVNSSGLTGAAPIWNEVMRTIYGRANLLDEFRVDGQILPDLPNAPNAITRRTICNVRTITDPTTNCAQTSEWFLNGPAGVPGPDGNLIYERPGQIVDRGLSNGSALLQEISPDIYRARVIPLNPAVAAGIQFQVPAGETPPPPPRYCRVTDALGADVPGAQDLIFIAGPATSGSDAVAAERYAQSNNYAYLPTVECWDANLAGGNGWGPPVVTAVISSPSNGQTVSGVVTFAGTVQFDRSQADFYHLDIVGGAFSDWTPLGEEGFSSVVNGTLGTVDTRGLGNGTYRVRLRLVKDSSFVQQPYEVAFTVAN